MMNISIFTDTETKSVRFYGSKFSLQTKKKKIPLISQCSFSFEIWMKGYSKHLFFIKPIILDGPPGIKSSGFVTLWSNHLFCTVGSKHTERLSQDLVWLKVALNWKEFKIQSWITKSLLLLTFWNQRPKCQLSSPYPICHY